MDVPYPADYGGVIDIFYRIKALHKLGFEITLHVFEYGRGKQPELEKYARVFYYKRNRSIFHLFSKRPFIVQSRKNDQLLKNLLQDDSPILFEGIHTCWYLENEQIQRRLTFIRMHNIEHEYYDGLVKNSQFMKRLFFQQEVKKLKDYQFILSKASHILAIKKQDAEQLKKLNPNVSVLPASVPEIEGAFVKVKRYALFHGNLSVPENYKAAVWIIQTLKSVLDSTFPLIIAGKNPGKKLREICKINSVELIIDPSEKQLDQLVQEAQIHVLYTDVASGIKLKLLSCLHSSGHILLNSQMVDGTPLEDFCVVSDDAKDYKMHYLGLMNKTLTQAEFEKRHLFIQKNFNNENNCFIIKTLIEAHAKV